jgi:hypothetical protein
MARTHSNIKFDLSTEQETLLKEVQSSNMKLSKRQNYVLNAVLVSRQYHENHQYHLKTIRENWIKFLKKPQLNDILP